MKEDKSKHYFISNKLCKNLLDKLCPHVCILCSKKNEVPWGVNGETLCAQVGWLPCLVGVELQITDNFMKGKNFAGAVRVTLHKPTTICDASRCAR